MIQVGTDNRLYGHNGERIYLRGVHLFDQGFAPLNDGYRTDWSCRYILYPNTPLATSPPIGQYPAAGLTGLALVYVDDATAYRTLVRLKSLGFNTIRFFVETAFMNTAAFTDTVTGVSFPTEPEIVDKLIAWTRGLDMYVVITYSHASAPDATAATFWGWMGSRYHAADNVIFELQNEPGNVGGIVYVDPAHPTTSTTYDLVMPNVSAWSARMGPCLTAIRNAGFAGPVAVSPLTSLWGIDTIASALDDAGQPFLNDPNLIVSVHIYYLYGNTATAFSVDLPGLTAHVADYARYHCVICTECGFTTGINYTDATAATAWLQSALGWMQKEQFNGAVFFCVPPVHLYPYNDIFNATTGAVTTWGQLVLDYNVSAAPYVASFVPVITATTP